jgi:hypothetical protein
MRVVQEGVLRIKCYRTVLRPTRQFSYIVTTQEYLRTWMGSIYLATTGVVTPDRPFRSELPYRLSFRGRCLFK